MTGSRSGASILLILVELIGSILLDPFSVFLILELLCDHGIFNPGGIGGLDFDKPGGGFGFEANEPCGVLGGGGGGCLGGILLV